MAGIIIWTASAIMANSSIAAQLPANRITAIDFRRNADAAGRLEITLTGLDDPIDINRLDDSIIVTLPATHLPPRLARRLDVRDFATPVQYVDSRSAGNNTRIVITAFPNADFTYTSRHMGNQVILQLAPVEHRRQAFANTHRNTPRFDGQRISLSFQKIDIRAVLQIIADVADVNMVVADSVTGTVTLRLEDVPWDQALHLILSAHGLGTERVGNIMKIASLEQIAARQQAELNAYVAARDLSPLQTEIVQINYASAADVATIIQSGQDKTAMLSPRGRVTVDKRTNSLLVTDTPERIASIKAVLQRLDNPVRQVLVKARIVEANRGFSRELGVSMVATSDPATGVPNVGSYTGESGFTINLPVINSGGQLVTSIIDDTLSLDLALDAMEIENRGKIISEPRVITTDGQEAVIEQGTEIPYTAVQDDGQTSVEFKEVLLNLTVTPHVTPNDQVLLDMELTQDTVANFSVKGEPAIATRRLQTQVLVNNGDTVVLGGIFKKQQRNKESQIPLLGDIPVVGALFSNTTQRHEQRELLLFITPHILQTSLSAGGNPAL